MLVRLLRIVIPSLMVAIPAVATAVACNDDAGIACAKDADCPTGNICRDTICGLLNPDGGFATDADDNPDFDDEGGSCSEDGVPCTIAAECCSNLCDESKCAETASSIPTCKNANELCQDDCCVGLTCRNGACQ